MNDFGIKRIALPAPYINMELEARALSALAAARQKLYSIAGGGIRSNDVKASWLTTAERTEYFRSAEFIDWVAAEKALGRQVFWLKDVDKTQGAGDIFTFFFKWRADNGKFTPEQLAVIRDFMLSHRGWWQRWGATSVRFLAELCKLDAPKFATPGPYDVLTSWYNKEDGGEGVELMDFWGKVYWPSQVGMTEAEKLAQVAAFAPHYAAKVYPGVAEENKVLTDAGVEVVIVSNGDQELAKAVAPIMGVRVDNVVGSRLLYGPDGRSLGKNHSYEVFGAEWAKRPQPGKHLFFHYWVYSNRARWGWDQLNEEQIVIGGRDGDSASADGGMMILLPSPAIGNFMVDTPNEPNRVDAFYAVASKYGWTRGQFIRLVQSPSKTGARPD